MLMHCGKCQHTNEVWRLLNLDLLHRSLWMFHWVKKHKRLLPAMSFDRVIESAMALITSTQIDDFFLQLHGLTDESLMEKGLLESTCIRVLVNVATGFKDEVVDTLIDDAAGYHLRVASLCSRWGHAGSKIGKQARM